MVELYHKTKGNGFDFSAENKGNIKLAVSFLHRELKQGYYPVCANVPQVKIFIDQKVGLEADLNQCFPGNK